MAGIDVIVSWPRNCDYPSWRQFIRDERKRFDRVIAVFTEHDGGDYREWLRINCPEVEFIDSPSRQGRDWRDVAVNAALDISTAERVWFTEQDFFVVEHSFWDASGRVVGFNAGDGRPLHPASILVDGELVDKTSRYFGTEPIDHFYRFGVELCSLAQPVIQTTGFIHFQGTTQNHSLIDRGEEEGIFKRDQFREYLKRNLLVKVPLEEGWVARARQEIA